MLNFGYYSSIVNIRAEDRFIYLNKIQSDPSYKAAFVRSLTKTLLTNRLSPKDRRFTFCKEVLMTMPIVIYTKKNFYLLEKFSEKIEIFKAAGLVEFWNYQFNNKNILNFRESQKPKILSIHHLFGSFEILFLGWGVSFVAFSTEVFAMLITKHFEKSF